MSKIVVYNMPKDMYEHLKEYANERGITMSAAIKIILKEYFEEGEPVEDENVEEDVLSPF